MISDASQAALTPLIRGWNLDFRERSLLGIATNSALSEYERRAVDLLKIRSALLLLIQEPPGLADAWIRSSNKAFDGRTPLQVLLEEQDEGFNKIGKYLSQLF